MTKSVSLSQGSINQWCGGPLAQPLPAGGAMPPPLHPQNRFPVEGKRVRLHEQQERHAALSHLLPSTNAALDAQVVSPANAASRLTALRLATGMLNSYWTMSHSSEGSRGPSGDGRTLRGPGRGGSDAAVDTAQPLVPAIAHLAPLATPSAALQPQPPLTARLATPALPAPPSALLALLPLLFATATLPLLLMLLPLPPSRVMCTSQLHCASSARQLSRLA